MELILRHPLERPNYCHAMDDEALGENVSLDEFDFQKKLKKFLKKEWGIGSLFPPQAEALPLSLGGSNLILAIPTASGKSLVAHITMASRLSNELKGRRGVYIVPLKALASEKFEELKEICSCVGLSVGLAIGDRSSETSSVEDADILVCTSEKLDSLVRGRPSLLDDIGIVVADEFHLLNEPSRGPTLEILLSRIRHGDTGVQLLALSATVGNADELADWLDAELIVSNWRPVALYSGTLTGLDMRYHSVESPIGREVKLPEERRLAGGVQKNLHAVLDDTVSQGKQLLVFVSSRSSAQKEARELSKHVKSMIKKEGNKVPASALDGWEEISREMVKSEGSSATVKALGESIKGGVAFHHAGLTSSHRKMVENGFKKGEIFCVVATPTLAQGINLPASRVVVRDTRRWSTAASRNMPLPVMEIKQMMGRAGRPGFDDFGEAFLVSKSADEEQSLIDLYLRGEPEDVTSKLANPNAMRAEEDGALLAHILSVIATAGISDRDAITRFLGKTFLSTQMDPENLEERVDDVLCWLANNGMIERTGESEEVRKRILAEEANKRVEEDWEDEVPAWVDSAKEIPGLDILPREEQRGRRLTPRRGPAIFGFRKASLYESAETTMPEPPTMTYSSTSLGSRISRLYLNPISGKIIHEGLSKAMSILSGEDDVGQLSPLSLLHLAACTPDFLPLWPRKGDFDAIQEALYGHERELLADSVDLEEERRMKGVLVVQSWMEEKTLEYIEEQWGVQPGDLRSRVELLEWLLFAMRRILAEDDEFSNLNKGAHKTLYDSIDEVHRRVRYGCKSDILGLVAIKGVGRVRAREMADTLGVSDASDVSMLTERDKGRLSDLRGWSPKMVENIVSLASRSTKGRR